MPKITTHVLDVSLGRPAKGVRNVLYQIDSLGAISCIADCLTTETGRNGSPLLDASKLPRGGYKLEFHIGDYFRARGVSVNDFPFLDIIPIVFGINDFDANYHIPLVVSPYSYSTYRGS